MLRSRLVPVLFLVVFAVPNVHGDDPKPPAGAAPAAPPTPQQMIEAVQKDLAKKLAALQADIDGLKAQAARMEAAQGVLADSWLMRNQIDGLQSEVARLRDQLGTAERPSTSAYGPSGGYNRMPAGPGGQREALKPGPGTRESLRPAPGTVHIVNRSIFDREVYLNGRYHLVGAGTSVDVSVPPGEFQYEVVGLTPLTVREIGAGLSRTVSINW